MLSITMSTITSTILGGLRSDLKTESQSNGGQRRAMARNLDGRYRNHNLPMKMPNSILIARWVESEALALKLLGLSFAAIATRIVAIARGTQMPMTLLPPAIGFPDHYKITAAGCHKAVRRALNREPRVGADLLAQIILQRSDDLYLSLQPAIRREDTKAILTAVRVLELQANIAGANGKLPAPPTPEPEPEEQKTSPAIIDLFSAGYKVLASLGAQVPGYRIVDMEPEPKAIETTARNAERLTRNQKFRASLRERNNFQIF